MEHIRLIKELIKYGKDKELKRYKDTLVIQVDYKDLNHNDKELYDLIQCYFDKKLSIFEEIIDKARSLEIGQHDINFEYDIFSVFAKVEVKEHAYKPHETEFDMLDYEINLNYEE